MIFILLSHLSRDLPVLSFHQFSDLVLRNACYLPLPSSNFDFIVLILYFLQWPTKCCSSLWYFLHPIRLCSSCSPEQLSSSAWDLFLPSLCHKISHPFRAAHRRGCFYCFLYDSSKLYITVAVHFNYTVRFLGNAHVNRIYVLLDSRRVISA